MKKILFLLLLLVPIAAFSQVPFEMGAVKIDSIYWNESTRWVDEVSILPGSTSTHNQLITAKATYDFVQDSVASMIHDSIANIDFTTVSLQDSIDVHTDTLQSHNARLKVMELIDHTHSNKAVLDATTASFTTTINSTISNHTQYIADLNDSTARHTDTLQSHDSRLKDLENYGVGGIEITLEEQESDTFVVVYNNELAYKVGGSGSGTVDTTGLPVANQVTYFTSATEIGGDADFTFDGDTVKILNLIATDSTTLEYLEDDTNERWAGISVNKKIFADSIADAGFMLSQEICPIKEYMKDIQNSEIAWLYKDKNGVLRKSYGLSGLKPTYALQALMGNIERSFRYILVLSEKNEVLERELHKTQAELDDLKERVDALETNRKIRLRK